MSIVKYKNQSGVTYAYEATSRYDPATKQSRPTRKYLGRVDDETGEIIPTAGKRGRPPKNPPKPIEPEKGGFLPDSHSELAMKLSAAEAEIAGLRAENEKLTNEKKKLLQLLSKLVKESSALLENIHA